MNRNHVRVYEEWNDDSAYEHVNPNLIKRCYIDSTDANGIVYVGVEYWQEEQPELYPFPEVKAAQRFINRVAGLR